ncbi:MAG: hypothetical protein DRP47_00690 [Candidatus Zixiibacteriota bacterium]|nr:MAG: hypothetical protein DRP47_00690 [candidate division Zixibacteria bacterium]
MKIELRSISLWSFIKISVFVNLILGFIFGLFYAVFLSMFMSLFANIGGLPLQEFEDSGMSIAVIMIAVPIMFSLGAALFSTIWGIVCVLTYNLVTMLTGGLQINIDDISEPAIQEPLQQPMTAYTAQTPVTPPSPPPATAAPPAPLDPDTKDQNPLT